MEFGRRMAVERDLEKSEASSLANVIFDDSGHFIMYATMLGIKLINLYTNRCVKIIGKNENLRLLNLALYQGKIFSYYICIILISFTSISYIIFHHSILVCKNNKQVVTLHFEVTYTHIEIFSFTCTQCNF